MFLNMDQLEKKLDKEEFQEIGSMAAFKVLKTQFQTFIKSRIYLDDENSIDKRALHKRDFDSRVNERQMQTTEEKVDMSKALDANEEPMAEVQTTVNHNMFATEQQHTEQSEFNNEGEEKGFAIAALKNELRKLKGNSVNTKFAKSSILGKPILQSLRNLSVFRQPTAFKSERPRISKQRFASQVAVNNDLSKLVTPHCLPKIRESALIKPHHVIASSESRYSSNDMVHNHYLDEAKKKTHESGRNSRPSVMPSARSQSTSNDYKLKPRSNTQTSRNWPASKSSFITIKTVPIAEHSRNSRNFSDSKHFVPCHKTTNRNKPVKQISVAKKPERQITTGHRFSIKKTSVVHEKTKTPRSCLRWKLTGRILKTIGLRWVSTGKIFTSSITKVDSEPKNGSNEDNQYECEQILDVSAGTSFNPKKEGLKVWLLKRLISQKLGL
ncbi:hypothetical protein Tco_1415460 [Tanacetum coccineum]